MLHRIVTRDGLVYYRSPLLAAAGVPHGFSTRQGGVSAPPFDSLNLGNPNGQPLQDAPDHLEENYRRFLAAIGCAGRELCRVHQVHGRHVVSLPPGAADCCHDKADALVTDDPDKAVSVRVADCVPILLCSDDGRMVAAVHAGWRGVVANVVAATVEILRQRGAGDPATYRAAVGPCIGGDAFEVGPEVLQAFAIAFNADVPLRHGADGKGHVDLRRAVHRQLQAVGLKAEQIDQTDCCTFRDDDTFFSHRRQRGLTGRMAAVIAPRAPADR